ncbi:MAG: galactokinase [Saprospiraceae bacterium]
MNKTAILAAFAARFGEPPEVIVRAPGRINLIGEHTDYNSGFVLPAAIDRAIWLSASRRHDGRFAFFAADLNAFFLSENTETVFQREQTWANYLLGVISEARKDGLLVGGLNVAIGGDVPLGAGLSSSAALESGMLFAANELYRLGLSRMDIVRMAQRGENNFVGMKCGIMDMFASVMGRANSVMRLDCRNLDFQYFPFDTPGYSLVLFDSGVKHALVDTEYNTRRAECEAGVAVLRQFDPNVSSLRDVSPGLLTKHREAFDPTVYRRCKFVTEEIARVGEACTALQNGDLEHLGQIMVQCHDGLNLEYEVCVPETNFLVEQARKNYEVAGARQMGGGFGGCTINLVKTNRLEQFAEETATAYRQEFGLELSIYPVRLTEGVTLIHP